MEPTGRRSIARVRVLDMGEGIRVCACALCARVCLLCVCVCVCVCVHLCIVRARVRDVCTHTPVPPWLTSIRLAERFQPQGVGWREA